MAPLTRVTRCLTFKVRMRAQTRLTTKGQVVIPKRTRESLRWHPGTRLRVETTADGSVVLSPLRGERSGDFTALLDRACGLLTEGDPIRDLEAEHRSEVRTDDRRRP